MDELAQHLARTARRLGLDARNVTGASPEQLLALAEAVLGELAVRGLVEGAEAIDCWATPRVNGNEQAESWVKADKLKDG